jgi:carbonic anhydrase
MKSYEKLMLQNRAWSLEKLQDDPNYFARLAPAQNPEFLWIGCSDSRVPSTEITGCEPGEMFVHRNIANMVIHTDINLQSVLQYAVDILKVRHIIVCGHYECGGIRAALTHGSYGMLNKWLRGIKDVCYLYREELELIVNEDEKLNQLTELNVREQVLNLAKTSIVQRSWSKNKTPHLHGWVYGLDDGLISPVCEIPVGTRLHPIYEFYDDQNI